MKIEKNHSKMITIRMIYSLVIIVPFCSLAYSQNKKPNFIIIFTDDVGYNDFGAFGSKAIKTPNIDKMSEEGIKLTNFYAQTVCGPSRGALMTGRYPTRIGGGWRVDGDEITLAEVMSGAGYQTGCVGKWDMSERAPKEGMVPNDQGFGYYFGPLGANDGGKVEIYRNREAQYITHDMASLTGLYTDEALNFIEEKQDSPFFLYLAYTMAHVVIDATEQFKGKSDGELYGDVIEEIDWNVGRVLKLLDKLNLDENTYVLLTSDNGPWASREDHYKYTHGGQLATGSAYPLRSSKGSPYEGGFRVPAVFWSPGMVPSGVVKNGMISTLDILPTFAKLANTSITQDRVYDGFDQSEFLTTKRAKSNRNEFYYYIGNELQAVRQGKWKVLLPNPKLDFFYVKDPYREAPELYDLESDISEKENLAEKLPERLSEMLELAEKNKIEPDPNTFLYANPVKIKN